MKISILAFLVCGVSLIASADPSACGGNLEAQFIASYSKVTHSAGQATFVLTNFADFQENANCPLDIDDVSQALITLPDAQNYIQNGGTVSGVLVYNQATNTYSIE